MASDELVAVYDPADGRVVGGALRAQVRAEKLSHAATAALLLDDLATPYTPDGRAAIERYLAEEREPAP